MVDAAAPARGRGLAWAVFLLFAALLVAPNAINVRIDSPTGRIARVTDLLIGLGFWLLWFALFARLWWGALLAALLCASWLPLEWFLRTQVGSPVTSLFIGMAAETHAAELHDFFSTHGVRLVPGVLALLAVAGAAIVLARRHGLAWTHRSRRWALLLLPALGLLLHSTSGPAQGDAAPDEARKPMNQDNPQERLFAGVYPLDGPLALAQFLDERGRVRAQRRGVEQFRFAARRSGDDGAELLVFVIGESARADHWQLAGYARATTPRLAAQAGLVYLDDVITRSVATRTAVPALVSRQPVLRADGTPNPQVEPSVLRALAEVGFRTAWISNQGSTEVDAAVSFHARDAQTLRYINPASYAERGTLDADLLVPLARAMDAPGPAAIVLHTLGSHFNYAHRYPAAFDRFQPSLSTPGHGFDRGSSSADEIANAYDNSVLYTDTVLADVIAQVQRSGRRAAVVYVSDHGEDLYEKGCFDVGLVRNSAAAFRVPAFVWLSPALQAARPSLLGELQAVRARPQANDFVFDTLLDLARVQVAASKAPAEGVGLLDRTRGVSRRVVNQRGREADFDSAAQRNRCRIGD